MTFKGTTSINTALHNQNEICRLLWNNIYYNEHSPPNNLSLIIKK